MAGTVEYDETRRIWVLQAASTSYAVACPESVRVHGNPFPDPLLHVYWGSRITLADAVTLAGLRVEHFVRRGWESPLDGAEEYPVAGGLRFGVPALSARYSGNVRSVELAYVGYAVDGGELTVAMADEDRGLYLNLHYRVRGDVDVVERWAEVTNRSAEPIELSRVDSAAWTMPAYDTHRLSHLVSRWSAETQLRRTVLTDAETVLTSRVGVSSHHNSPWFAIDDGTATESTGEVYSGALAWAGSWRMVVQRLPTGATQVVGGFGHEDFGPYRLASGETLTTPVFAGLYTPDGFGAASRAWHDFQLRYVVPDAGEVRPVLYNSWEATLFDVNERNQRELARRAAAIGVELFVVDDGWFGGRVNDRAGLGDWWVNTDRFPDGLTPLIDEVHELGMTFGIWVEPEMVNPDSELYREHPDWVYHFPGRRRSEIRNQLVLNLARDDVADWMFEQVDRLLAENRIDFVKWDMNRAFTEAGWPSNVDNPDRLWLDHVHNLYAVFDRLRVAHPGVAFESCSSGGGRVDLGILARTDQVWTSDNTDGSDRLIIQHGFSQVHPARVMSCWVTDVPNFLDHRSLPLTYRFHSAMAGVLGVGGDLADWSEEDLATASELIATYKRVRPVIQLGRQYRLRPPSESLGAVQYVSADGTESVVLGYREAQRFGEPAPLLRLAGLDDTASYRVDDGEAVSGAVLQRYGLRLDLRGDYASTLVHLVRVDGT